MGKRDSKFDGRDDKRIGRLDEHTLGYYRRVANSLEEGFEEDDDKGKTHWKWILPIIAQEWCTESNRRCAAVSCSRSELTSGPSRFCIWWTYNSFPWRDVQLLYFRWTTAVLLFALGHEFDLCGVTWEPQNLPIGRERCATPAYQRSGWGLAPGWSIWWPPGWPWGGSWVAPASLLQF